MSNSVSLRNSPTSVRALLLIVLIAAVLLGVYGRFKGLGTWPLGVDEFYISRSIDNVLSFGLPRFACGGYYTRGIAYQYGVAAMRLLGGSPELDGRLLAGVCSLATLPAAYLLTRRVAGSVAGWTCVALLAVSLWEIEMARFARMYAPFQAVFAWYSVCFLRFVIDRRPKALWAMAALSLLGVLTWEGGVLLGAANILAVVLRHREGRLSRAQWLQTGVLALLLALLFVGSRDFRGFATAPARAPSDAAVGVPDDAAVVVPNRNGIGGVDDGVGSIGGVGSVGVPAAAEAASSGSVRRWVLPAGIHAARLAWLIVPAGLMMMAWRWVDSHRRRPLALAALLAAAGASALHAELLALALLLLAHLAALVPAPAYRRGGGALFVAALAAFTAAWWMIFAPLGRTMAMTLLLGFPDVYDEVIRPWGRTVPILAAALAASTGYWIWRSRRPEASDPLVAASLCLLIAMLLGAASAGTDRLETRYTFFLYPMLLALGVAAVRRLCTWRQLPPMIVALAPLACFAATEDFGLRHIAMVDSARVNFRAGLSPALQAHFYPRNDVRGAADWIRRNTAPGDLIVSGVPNLSPYYPNFGFFFLRLDDDRYDTFVCPDGATERWSGRRVLYGDDALATLVDSGHAVFLVMYKDFERALEVPQNLARWSITPAWTSPFGDTIIVLIHGRRSHPES